MALSMSKRIMVWKTVTSRGFVDAPRASQLHCMTRSCSSSQIVSSAHLSRRTRNARCHHLPPITRSSPYLNSNQVRQFSKTWPCSSPSAAPKSKDRGPPSKEDTQTDFTAMDMLSNAPVPSTAIDACMDDGFALNSGLKDVGSGVLLLGGEAFTWRPWLRDGRKEGTIGAGGVGDDDKGVQSDGGRLLNARGQWDVDKAAWGVLRLVWPKPDLLVLGTGRGIVPISAQTRRDINELGVRVEVQDTRNAAAQFNLLATERGVQQVAAALIPIGWREGR